MKDTTPTQNKTLTFITLGCAKNEVDSDKMRARVLAAGFEVQDEPDKADAIIINTCSFITEATQEAIDVILEAAGLPNTLAGRSKIIVTGCMPSRYGAELVDDLPEVAAFVSCDDEHRIVEVLGGVLELDDTAMTIDTPSSCTRTTTLPWAYVKIADGCDRNCSFCTIPAIKGHYQSVAAQDIYNEVDELVAKGAREIILIAQDTGLWGCDFKTTAAKTALENNGLDSCPSKDGKTSAHNLAELLELLAERFNQTWFRVMYLQPQGITDELLAVMAKHANICNYFDIPLQHASPRIVKAMNRKGSGDEYLELLARIRSAMPDVALRTTVIAGFPGETKEEAKQLERFIVQAGFDYVGVFVYSQEEGTKAGACIDQVPMRTRKARAQRLRDLADDIGFSKTEAQVGSIQDVLLVEIDEDYTEDYVDGKVADKLGAKSKQLLGRTQRQAPEVDGVIHLSSGNIGDIVSARMVGAWCYDLDGEVE